MKKKKKKKKEFVPEGDEIPIDNQMGGEDCSKKYYKYEIDTILKSLIENV